MSDLAWYADRYGVSVEDAAARLVLQDEAGILEPTLAKKHRDTFAGLWIENEPVFRVVAAFTTAPDESLQPHIAGTPLEAIAEARSATFSLKELQADQKVVMQLHMSLNEEEDFDSQINMQENRVEILAATAESLTALVPALDDLPPSVVIREVEASSEAATHFGNMYGGLAVSCGTTGFTVNRIGSAATADGVTAAAHAGNVCTRNGDPLLHETPEAYGGSADVQWFSGHWTFRNWAADESTDGTPFYRTITSRTHRNNQTVGTIACKYGKVTGYNCGELINKFYDPNACIPNANPTWMRLHDPGTDLSETGDSGGPIYKGNSAWGMNACRVGDPSDSIYMAQNYMGQIDIQVWIG